MEAVTFDKVLQTLLITHHALQAVLGRAPRIGVAGLNPHAGEGRPVWPGRDRHHRPRRAGRACPGGGGQRPDRTRHGVHACPGASDQPGEFDVVVAMYHDQGLIPVKYLGVDKGVNVTLGLPLVRTSPDHGTAFDIAGTGQADAASLIEAIRMARQLIPSGLKFHCVSF